MKRGRNQRRRQGVNPNRALDSNGPDVRIRGTANQIYDKYQALARDAQSSGDRVKAENYLQHAEHYFRVIRATQPNHTFQQDNAGEEGDADQPSIGGFDNNERREPRRDNDGRRDARNGRGDYDRNQSESGEPGDDESESQDIDNQTSDVAAPQDDENADAKGPRSRRRRRPRAPRSEDGAEEPTPEDVAAG